MRVEIAELLAEIEQSRQHLAQIQAIYHERLAGLSQDERSLEKAVLLADVFVNYYTCLETIFFRIAQFFENSLPTERWHAELLDKMRLQIAGVRESVISAESYMLLDELRRFRHFKRYYFSMDYDWDRLEFLSTKFVRLLQTITIDLDQFH